MKVFAKELNKDWKLGANHVLYHRYGEWYHRLREFPAALLDANGYVWFQSEDQYLNCSHLKVNGNYTNVNGTLSDLPDYTIILKEAIDKQ
jgi:5-methylcytosine-specific restriction protein A